MAYRKVSLHLLDQEPRGAILATKQVEAAGRLSRRER